MKKTFFYILAACFFSISVLSVNAYACPDKGSAAGAKQSPVPENEAEAEEQV